MPKCQLLVAAALLIGGAAVAAELQSGLGKGEFVPAFHVLDVTGPSKGEELCYRCKFGDRPVVTIFAREVSEPVAKLAKEIDAVVAKNKDAQMKSFLVLMTDNPDDAGAKLAQVAEKQGIKNIPFTTFKGVAGPSAYKISKDADVTVMMWVDSAVKVSRGYGKGQLDGKAIEQLVADTKQILE